MKRKIINVWVRLIQEKENKENKELKKTETLKEQHKLKRKQRLRSVMKLDKKRINTKSKVE